MAKYTVIRTDTADSLIHKIILGIAEKFGAEVALEKLDELEGQIILLADNPYIGTDPRYMILRRQGYKVLIYCVNCGTEVCTPTPSIHRLRCGLPGYLILFVI